MPLPKVRVMTNVLCRIHDESNIFLGHDGRLIYSMGRYFGARSLPSGAIAETGSRIQCRQLHAL